MQMPAKVMAVLSTKDYKLDRETTVAGLAAVQYVSPRARDTSVVIVAKEIALPAKAMVICDYIFVTPVGIHAANRVILRRRVLEKKTPGYTYLDTTIARAAELAPSTFEVPQGYRLVEPGLSGR